MTNVDYVKRIKKMSAMELLGEIIRNPSYLTDPYYRAFGRAIEERYTMIKITTPNAHRR
jgi:hypothetical protein